MTNLNANNWSTLHDSVVQFTELCQIWMGNINSYQPWMQSSSAWHPLSQTSGPKSWSSFWFPVEKHMNINVTWLLPGLEIPMCMQPIAHYQIMPLHMICVNRFRRYPPTTLLQLHTFKKFKPWTCTWIKSSIQSANNFGKWNTSPHLDHFVSQHGRRPGTPHQLTEALQWLFD